MKNLKSILLLAFLCVNIVAEAQIGSYFDRFRPAKKWSAGVQLNATALHGDADDITVGLAYGVHVKYSIAQSFGLKLNFNMGQLKAGRQNPNIGRNGNGDLNSDSPDGTNVKNPGNQAPGKDSYVVTNNFKELNINTVYTLGNISFLRPLRKVQLFLFTGAGVIWSDAEGSFTNPADAAEYANDYPFVFKKVDKNSSGDVVQAYSNYKGMNMAIPFGLGFKWNVGPWIDLGVEYRMTLTRSDQIDAFSFEDWRNRSKDYYSMLGIQGSFKFGGKDKDNHYDWLNPVESIYNTLDSLIELEDKVEQLLLDDDEDGVANYYDSEPETEEGAWTDGKGRTLDIDGDGVPDFRDDQPYSEKGSEVDDRGVMIDVDHDGIPDYRDKDTNTPASSVINTDGEAVNVGCCNCDEVVLPAIVFDNGSYKIRPEFYGALYSVAEKMRSCPDLKVDATGYAVGSKAASQLAEKRINAIIDYLNGQYGIPRDRIISNSNGEAESGLEYKSRRIDLSKSR